MTKYGHVFKRNMTYIVYSFDDLFSDIIPTVIKLVKLFFDIFLCLVFVADIFEKFVPSVVQFLKL